MGPSSYAIVAVGSALGGALRHGVNVAAARLLGAAWPFGTLTVNVVGSFVIGGVVAFFALRGHGASPWLLFLTTGVLGGFTTFSAFSLDAVLLYERGHAGLAALYVAVSVLLSVGATFTGLAVIRRVL
jgi:fluoride exporter